MKLICIYVYTYICIYTNKQNGRVSFLNAARPKNMQYTLSYCRLILIRYLVAHGEAKQICKDFDIIEAILKALFVCALVVQPY